jgi:hypothetical protein
LSHARPRRLRHQRANTAQGVGKDHILASSSLGFHSFRSIIEICKLKSREKEIKAIENKPTDRFREGAGAREGEEERERERERERVS